MFEKRSPGRWFEEIAPLFLLLVAVVLVCSLRFDRNDLPVVEAVKGDQTSADYPMSDASCYVASVEYYRGNLDRKSLVLPFAYRILGPFVAAKLPIENPLTALNVLNVMSLAMGVLFLYLMLRTLSYSKKASFVGGMIYAVSFPVFYYGAIGLSDPLGIGLLALYMFNLFSKRWWALYPLLVIGALSRETTIVLLPVSVVYIWLANPRGKVWMLISVVAIFLATLFAVRASFADLGRIVWNPSVENLLSNLRGRALLANILSFGVPGTLTIVWLLSARARGKATASNICFPLLVGVLSCFAVAAYAFLGAYADGRFLWGIYIFAVPFAVDVVDRLGLSRFDARYKTASQT